MSERKGEVSLTAEQRDRLEQAGRSNKASIRERRRARVLLLLDTSQTERVPKDENIAKQVGVCMATVSRTRARFLERGLEGALYHKEQANRKTRVLDGEAEAHLIATVCSTPPEGRKRWGLHLLKDRLIAMEVVDAVSHETIRQTLKKTNSSLG